MTAEEIRAQLIHKLADHLLYSFSIVGGLDLFGVNVNWLWIPVLFGAFGLLERLVSIFKLTRLIPKSEKQTAQKTQTAKAERIQIGFCPSGERCMSSADMVRQAREINKE